MSANYSSGVVTVSSAAVLAALGDRIRLVSDPDDLAFAAAEILGEAFQVSRVSSGEIDKDRETITIERDWNAPGIRDAPLPRLRLLHRRSETR